MKTPKIWLSFALSLSLFFMGCSNVLDGLAGKSTDEALYEDAVKYLNKGQYDAALAKFGNLSSGFASKTVVLERWAGAYAGKCGLNFISYLNTLGSATFGANTFFQYLRSAWVGINIDPDSCALAESKIKQIWAQESATASQQLFMVILSMVKMGTYARYVSDRDGANNYGDGTTDAGYDSCNSAKISNAQVDEMITGLSLFLQNITSFAANFSADINNAKTAINTACGTLASNPCSTTDTASITNAQRAAMRDFLALIGFGIEATCVPTGNPMVPPETVNDCC